MRDKKSHSCWYCRHRGFPRAHYPPSDLLDLEEDWEPGELRCPPCHERIRAEEGNEGSRIPF